MLNPIKTFYIEPRIPDYSDWVQAVEIAKAEQCVVEVRWLPSKWAGWYHEYVFENSDPAKLATNTPKVYGV